LYKGVLFFDEPMEILDKENLKNKLAG